MCMGVSSVGYGDRKNICTISCLFANLSQTIGVILRVISKSAPLLRIPYGNRALPSASATNTHTAERTMSTSQSLSPSHRSTGDRKRSAGPYPFPLSISLMRTLAYPPHIYSVFHLFCFLFFVFLFFVPILFRSIDQRPIGLPSMPSFPVEKRSSRIGTVGQYTHPARSRAAKHGVPLPLVFFV